MRVPVPLAVGVLAAALVVAAFLLFNRPGDRPDGGAAAQLQPISSVSAPDYHSLAVSPSDPDRVWFGSHGGIQESADGGKSWRPLGSVSGDAMSLAMPGGELSKVYMAGHDIFKRSVDGGKSWVDVQSDLPGTDLHGFAADPTDANHLYALVVGHGLLESRDGGDRWQPMPAQPPGPVGALAAAPGEPPSIYVLTGLGLMRSQDGGKSWHRKDTGLPEGDKGVRAIAPAPQKPGELYAGTGNGLYRSTDEGVTWGRIALAGQDIFAIAASNSEPLRVYALAAQGAIYRLEGDVLR